MSQFDTRGHFSDELHASRNAPAAPKSLRDHFAIPMHKTIRDIWAHASSSMHELLDERKED